MTDYNSTHDETTSYCQLCGALPSEKTISSVSTTDTSEVTKELILCVSCESIHRLSVLCVRESKKTKTNESFVTELQVNRRKESRFRLYTFQRMSESKTMRLQERDLINSGSEEIGISPITARRYLDKLCSGAGVLTRYDDGDNVHIEFSMKRGDFIE